MVMNKRFTCANLWDHRSPNRGLRNQKLDKNGQFFYRKLLIRF